MQTAVQLQALLAVAKSSQIPCHGTCEPRLIIHEQHRAPGLVRNV